MSRGIVAPAEWADGAPEGVTWPTGARWVRSGGRVFLSTGPRVIRFLETRCVFTQARWVGQPMRLQPWQKRLVVDLFEIDPATGRRRYRWALIGMGKKQGKSELVAGLALYFLLADGERAPMVLCAGANDISADLVFNPARTMVETEGAPLSEMCEPYQRQILVPGQMNAEIRRVAASPRSTEGLNVFVAFLDELHEWTSTSAMVTFDKITNGTGAREEPMIIMTTTAGYDLDTLCGRYYEYGRAVEAREVEDEAFFFRWWSAPPQLDWRSEEAVAAANPNYGVTVQWPFYLDQQSKKPENIYRRYFLNQWTETEAAWLPAGAWAECADPALDLVPGWPTFIGWDAASKNDSTALVAVQRVPVIYETDGGEEEGERVVARAWIWERPWDTATRAPLEGWRLPIDEVTATLWALAERYDVRAIQFDPAFITWEAGRLEAGGLPMLEFPQHTIRLTQGSQRLYEMVVNGELAHDGDRVFARHIAAAVAREVPGSAAWRLVKGRERKKMDAAIAAAMAVWGLEHPPEAKAGAARKPNLYTFESERDPVRAFVG